ncbi:exopolysaccharide biosynthesis polyprenyl glycosylphosphotransferase [Altererythrobacter sp. Z27]|uniref:exopolysaccharide biosynthesis polyprenyl glycosylphosphotransferase n=1 Tax=Altererythrobacter sp. Z27 TaxID=3461147 RepID=UPI004043C81A
MALRYKIYLLVLLIDLAVVLSSFMIASLIRFGYPAAEGWGGLVVSITIFYVLGAFSWGAYTLEAITEIKVGLKRSLSSLLTAFGLLFLTFYLLKVGPDFSRAMSLMSLILSACLLILSRTLFRSWVDRQFGRKLVKRVFILDSELHCEMACAPDSQWVVAPCPEPTDVETQIQFAKYINGADRVIVSCKRKSADRWADVLRWSGVQGEILLPNYDNISPIGVGHHMNQPTLIVSTGPLDTNQRFAKRTLDLVIGTIMLLLCIPLIIMTAIFIKLDSPGPVFFRQARVGQGNVIFEIYKFRTMRADSTDTNGNVSASRDDKRITKLGHFLRKSSIDEIPQLFNVLIGNMSIVGPRPHALGSRAENELFWEVDDKYWYRHALKPGITGLAQIRGFRGATETKDHLRARVRADLEYIQGWSIWRDFSIIARTALVMVHPNAY